MWSNILRLIHEQQIYDPQYGLLDMDINLHFALYMKDILKDTVDFKDKKILLKGIKTSPLYLMCWFQVVLLKELLEEYVHYETVLKDLSEKQADLSDKQNTLTRNMSEMTFVRKNTAFTRNFMGCSFQSLSSNFFIICGGHSSITTNSHVFCWVK